MSMQQFATHLCHGGPIQNDKGLADKKVTDREHIQHEAASGFRMRTLPRESPTRARGSGTAPVVLALQLGKLLIGSALLYPALLLFMPVLIHSDRSASTRAAILTELSPWRCSGTDTIATGRLTAGTFAGSGLFLLYVVVGSWYLLASSSPFLAQWGFSVISAIFTSFTGMSLLVAASILGWDIVQDTLMTI